MIKIEKCVESDTQEADFMWNKKAKKAATIFGAKNSHFNW